MNRRTGLSAVRATIAPSAAASRMPTPATTASCTSRLLSSSSTSVSGRATWIAPSVADPDRQHAEVDAVHGHVAEVAPRAAQRGCTGARVDRQPARVGRIASLDGAVRGDLLHEPGGVSERVARLREVGTAGNRSPAAVATRSATIAWRPRSVLRLHHELGPARRGPCRSGRAASTSCRRSRRPPVPTAVMATAIPAAAAILSRRVIARAGRSPHRARCG